jgi:S1-C subfamily serine protease
MTMLGLLLVIVTAVPYLAEELQYRIERGRQRAQVEAARTVLRDSPLASLSQAYQFVSQRVSPSVVHINVMEISRAKGRRAVSVEEGEEDADESSRPAPGLRMQSGQGSGVIVDEDGYILTNRHVIDRAQEIEIALSDGRRRIARLVGLDQLTDIAVLKIDAPGLVPIDWGDSESLKVGALVWAIGSPFGLERSVTSGILSAKHRAGQAGTPFQDLMQTDAAVNPGNSGGPLVNAAGELIGINTAIVGQSFQGVSFAIPSRVAQRVYRDLKMRGQVARGWLGIEPITVSPQQAAELGFAAPRGALVRRLADDLQGIVSPARQAGIQAGDIIIRWDGSEVESPVNLIARVSQTPIDEVVAVVILRDGQEVTLKVTVAQRPVFEE